MNNSSNRGGRIRDEDVSYIRDHSAIDDVVGEFVQLKGAGGGAKKGLCPFHDEKSPSFHVTPAKGYFHCFGCGVGGDAIAFLVQYQHLSFMEAVERLADRIGYTLRYDGVGGVSTPGINRSRLVAANTAAAEFYREQLALPGPAQVGREFLTNRGFDKAAADHFGVGYAPDEWDALYKHLKAAQFSDQELSLAGLTKDGSRGPIDRFRNRLIWPIKDISGDVVGFGARKLASDEKDTGPKYLNTSETPIYKKSTVLYGLDLAKKDIAKKRQVVVVEGYTDVMAAHLAGITTAVATCGTAFGDDHIRMLRKILMDDNAFRGEVIFTFDGDAAGQKAALKAFGDDQKFVAQTFVAVEPSGMDPCELRQAKGDLALRDLIARRVPLFEFAMKSEIAKYDINSAEGRVSALNQVAPLVQQIKDPSLRPEYIKIIAGWLGMEVEVVAQAVKRSTNRAGRESSGPSAHQSEASGQQAERDQVNLRDPVLMLEREVLKIRLQLPELATEWANLEKNVFTYWAYHQLRLEIDGAADGDISKLIEQSQSEDVKSLITQLIVEPIRTDGEVSSGYISSVFARAREVAISRSVADVKSSLQRLNPNENEELYNETFGRLLALETEKKRLHAIAVGSSE